MNQPNLFTSSNAHPDAACIALIGAFCQELKRLDFDQTVSTINAARKIIHQHSPFSAEPVDYVEWVPVERIAANDYNPNSVAPPEMKLLEHSIREDGYTQPIVSWVNDSEQFEVVDGFHRNRVGRESKAVSERIHGYLPLTVVNPDRLDRGDRIAATIRHNRARGKHRIDAMSEIVVELKRRNWSDEKIGRELGMDPDEVLRLTQITGLAEMFSDREFSEAWQTDQIDESDSLEADDEVDAGPLKNKMPENGWDHRTDNRSVFSWDGMELARLNRAPNGQWNWTVYCAPMENGTSETREEARCETELIMSSKFSQINTPTSTE